MVIVSDNTATNLTIDSFGVNAVNARIASLGLKDTHLWKRVMKSAAGPMPADQRFGRLTKEIMEAWSQRVWMVNTCFETWAGKAVADTQVGASK